MQVPCKISLHATIILNICLTCYLLAKSSCDDTGKKNWENNTVIISKTGEKLLNHF